MMDREHASVSPTPTDHRLIYSPLDEEKREFRLIKLVSMRHSSSKQVEISLHTVSLLHPPRFVMISHGLARSSFTQTAVLCDGSQLEVTPMVEEILKSLQNDSANEATMYWLDAVCIDLRNKEETSEQVNLVAAIRSRADLTLGWTNVEISPSACTFLERVAVIAPKEPTSSETYGYRDLFQNDQRIKATDLTRYESGYLNVVRDLTGRPPTASVPGQDTSLGSKNIRRYVSSVLQAWTPQRKSTLSDFDENRAFLEICNLCDAEYFSSIWVLPDFVLSSRLTLRCGSVDIHWRTFCTALRAMIMSGVHMQLKSWQIENILVADIMREQCCIGRLSFADALTAVQSCSFVTHGTRDCLRALRTITDFGPYTEQLPLVYFSNNVKTIVASVCEYMTQRQGPTFLALAGTSQNENGTDTPPRASWAPDFTIQKRRLLLAHPSSHFSASPKSYPPVVVHHDKLRCYATAIDTVAAAAEYLPPRRICDQYDITGDNTYAFISWFELARHTENSSTVYGSDALLTRFAETIQAKGCNQIWEHGDLGDYVSLASKTRAFLQCLEDPDAPATFDMRVFHAGCLPSHDRRFGLTEKEHFCLLPQATLRGDIICTIRGFKVPVVLRKHGGQYKNVGECYVHGMMHGAADGTESYITIT